MQNHSLCEWRQFSGRLTADAFVVPLTFRAHLNPLGEIEFDFDDIAITPETYFLRNYLFPSETGFKYFSMIGKSDDGIELEIERIHFSSEY